MMTVSLELKDPNHKNVSESWDIVLKALFSAEYKKGWTYAKLSASFNNGSKVPFQFKNEQDANRFLSILTSNSGHNVFHIESK